MKNQKAKTLTERSKYMHLAFICVLLLTLFGSGCSRVHNQNNHASQIAANNCASSNIAVFRGRLTTPAEANCQNDGDPQKEFNQEFGTFVQEHTDEIVYLDILFYGENELPEAKEYSIYLNCMVRYSIELSSTEPYNYVTIDPWNPRIKGFYYIGEEIGWESNLRRIIKPVSFQTNLVNCYSKHSLRADK